MLFADMYWLLMRNDSYGFSWYALLVLVLASCYKFVKLVKYSIKNYLLTYIEPERMRRFVPSECPSDSITDFYQGSNYVGRWCCSSVEGVGHSAWSETERERERERKLRLILSSTYLYTLSQDAFDSSTFHDACRQSSRYRPRLSSRLA